MNSSTPQSRALPAAAQIHVDAEIFEGHIERLHVGHSGGSLTLAIERGADLTAEEIEVAMGEVQRAVNAHEAMVATLEHIVRKCGEDYDERDPLGEVGKIARAALALAKGSPLLTKPVCRQPPPGYKIL